MIWHQRTQKDPLHQFVREKSPRYVASVLDSRELCSANSRGTESETAREIGVQLITLAYPPPCGLSVSGKRC